MIAWPTLYTMSSEARSFATVITIARRQAVGQLAHALANWIPHVLGHVIGDYAIASPEAIFSAATRDPPRLKTTGHHGKVTVCFMLINAVSYEQYLIVYKVDDKLSLPNISNMGDSTRAITTTYIQEWIEKVVQDMSLQCSESPYAGLVAELERAIGRLAVHEI